VIDWTNPDPPSPRSIASICRCSTPQMHADRAMSAERDRVAYDNRKRDEAHQLEVAQLRARHDELAARTPRADQYEIQRVEQVGPHMVLEVLYPSCASCAYEGRKVLVILDVTPVAAMRWRRIDPHFRDKPSGPTEAPSPAARFPASPIGWSDAIEYATRRAKR
jgi:hypothetical protein